MEFMNEGTKYLETDRQVLKKGTQEDVLSAYEYDYRYLRSTDSDNKLQKTPDSILNGWNEDPNYYNSDIYDWYIFLKGNDKAIGNVVIDQGSIIIDGISSLNVAYNLRKEHWGNGYVPEALNTILEYMFNEVGIGLISCGYDGDNIKSKRVIEKIGFQFHKVLNDKGYDCVNNIHVDQYQYIMTKEMWNERKKAKR